MTFILTMIFPVDLTLTQYGFTFLLLFVPYKNSLN